MVKTRTKVSSSNRSSKALVLAEGVIKSLTTSSFFVPSQTVNGKVYEVKLSGQSSSGYECTCPDFEYRRQDDKCKHIDAVILVRKGALK